MSPQDYSCRIYTTRVNGNGGNSGDWLWRGDGTPSNPVPAGWYASLNGGAGASQSYADTQVSTAASACAAGDGANYNTCGFWNTLSASGNPIPAGGVTIGIGAFGRHMTGCATDH